MSDKGKAFFLGIFILLALALTAGLVTFLRPSLGDGKTKIRILFTNIDKISQGTRVTYAGKPVGEVYKIRLNPEARNQKSAPSGNLYAYELILKVDSSVKIYNSDKIFYSTSGLLGEKTVDISPRAPHENEPSIVVTDQLLAGDSQDKWEQTMSKLVNVAESLNDFISENKTDFHETLQSFKKASEGLSTFTLAACDTNICGNVSDAFRKTSMAMEKVDVIFNQIHESETFNRLLCSDSLYLRLNAVLSQFEVTLSDINRYGLLFQFSGKWQKERKMREQKLNSFLTQGNFTPYFHEELNRIGASIAEISCLLEKVRLCKEMPEASVDFRCLLEEVDRLQHDLETYNQALNLQLGY